MFKPLTVADIRYICHSMMGVDWLPSFIEIPLYLKNSSYYQKTLAEQKKILEILSVCQSKLEVMYFLGIGYYLHSHAMRRGGVSEDYPPHSPHQYQGQKGIFVLEPFVGGEWGNGFSSLLVVPQYQSPEKPIHHDFGLFEGESNGGGPWHFVAAVEIEGYAAHKQRRKADETRYAGLSYPVISVYEEISSPLEWYNIFDPDVETGLLGEWYNGGDEEDTDDDPF